VNAIAARLRAAFPNLALETYHVAGVANPVDGLSRNGEAMDPVAARAAAEECINRVVVG
jgi:hypothetical protein